MAKTLTIHDPVTDKTYILEFTRKTVAQLERQGFIAEEVAQKPMSICTMALLRCVDIAKIKTVAETATVFIFVIPGQNRRRRFLESG